MDDHEHQGGASRVLDRIRGSMLASLHAEWRWWLRGVWAGLLLLLVLFMLLPLLPVSAPAQGDVEDQFSDLTALEKREVAAPTQVEIEQIARLSFVSSPLGPTPPPAQAVSALAANELFGVPTDHAQAFNQTTQALRDSAAACAEWINRNHGEAPAGVSPNAQASLDQVTRDTGSDRGVFHYHQGLIDLCGPNAASAKKEFQPALASYDDFAKKHGGIDKTPVRDRRRLAQYQAVTGYGMGLAMLAADDAPEAIDKVLDTAGQAALKAKAYAPAGPFVTFAATGCAVGTQCELFNFSTAEIDNARLYVWLKKGKPGEAFKRLGSRLGGAPSYVAQHPALAANFAAAAAASGHPDLASDLYAIVRRDLQAGDGVAAAWTGADRRALARLAALAATSANPVYADGDAWWPTSVSPSGARRKFEAKHFDRDAAWFPSVALEDPNDEGVVDLWLWIRRGRALLRDSHYGLFRNDGVAIANLGPGDHDTLERWRREVTGRLGDALLRRARVIQVRDGPKAARPLLQLLGGSDFPFMVEMRARAMLRTGRDPLSVLLLDLGLLALAGLAAWAHLQLAAGHRRTFTQRHYLQRVKREDELAAAKLARSDSVAGPEADEAPDSAPESGKDSGAAT
jgi:hypothetical protein